MDKIEDIIQKRRKEFGITQNDLAEMAGVGINTISRLESGKGTISLRSLQKILSILGLEINLVPSKRL